MLYSTHPPRKDTSIPESAEVNTSQEFSEHEVDQEDALSQLSDRLCEDWSNTPEDKMDCEVGEKNDCTGEQ